VLRGLLHRERVCVEMMSGWIGDSEKVGQLQ
jgi:hypothetical protein